MQNEDQTEASGIPGIDDELPALPVPDELTTLKGKADLMGLSYHPSIGLEKLRAKVAEALAGEGAPNRDEVAEPATPVAAVPTQAYQAASLAPVQFEKVSMKTLSPRQYADQESLPVPGETAGERRLRMKRHANELIRIRVTCMDPAKKEWEGEIIGAGNNLVGTLTKFVPFGIDEGWHVPRIMYNVLRDRMAQIFITVTDPVSKQKVRNGKLIKAFAIDVLDQLTEDELKELAARQAATRSIDA